MVWVESVCCWADPATWREVALMSAVTLLYTTTFAFKFVLTWVGSSESPDVVISDEAVASLDGVGAGKGGYWEDRIDYEWYAGI